MTRTQDLTLIGLVSAMFLTNLILIGLIASYAVKVTNNDYRYELLKEDYTRLIHRVEMNQDVEIGRIQEQIQGLQFIMDKRFGFTGTTASPKKGEDK
tara:strand:- start:77 stop:367 length:291 start_codon:yes stop_codon:yes gene_type:complete